MPSSEKSSTLTRTCVWPDDAPHGLELPHHISGGVDGDGKRHLRAQACRALVSAAAASIKSERLQPS